MFLNYGYGYSPLYYGNYGYGYPLYYGNYGYGYPYYHHFYRRHHGRWGY